KNSDRQKKPLSGYARYTSLAAQMLVTILAGVFGGIYLDKFLDWNFPVFTLLLTLIAVFLSMYLMIREVST
ncbi:MAG: AtpZ/AtpI family protein, partial [Bacteroidia bacterium]